MSHGAKAIDQTPVFRMGDTLVDAVFDKNTRAQSAYRREYSEGPIECLPGVMSTDPRFLQFKDQLTIKLTDAFPASVDDYGRVTGNGVRSNFYGGRHINGYPMLPSTIPLADNRHYRSTLGLSNSFVEPWHETFFRSLVKTLFAEVVPGGMKWRNGSSTVCPYFDNTNAGKRRMALDLLTTGKAKEAGEMILRGNAKDAFLLYRVGGAIYIVYRQQSSDAIELVDGEFIAKKRMVADELYAVTGGLKGRMFEASKSIDNIELEYKPKGFFRTRSRTAMGVPFGINSTLMPVAQALRTGMYNTYGYTFHHTTREQKKQKIANRELIIMTDVSNHDILWPAHIYLPAIKEELLSIGYPEWWVALFETVFKLPIYLSSPGPNLGHFMIGDWRKPNLHPGLTSGNAFTDIAGAIGMTFVYALMQVEHTAPHMIRELQSRASCDRFWAAYLRGDLEFSQMSKSDDAALAWSAGPNLRNAYQLYEKLKKGEKVSPYMLISYEHGGAFLGDILLYDHSKSPKTAEFIGNIQSMVNNQFSPEYSVQSSIRDRSKRKRPYPGLAWRSIKQTYGSSPIYGEVMELIERTWRQSFGGSYAAYREALLEEDTIALAQAVAAQKANMQLANLSSIDLEVLADPDKLHYKYAAEDVSPAVLDSLMAGLTEAEVAPYLKEIFG